MAKKSTSKGFGNEKLPPREMKAVKRLLNYWGQDDWNIIPTKKKGLISTKEERASYKDANNDSEFTADNGWLTGALIERPVDENGGLKSSIGKRDLVCSKTKRWNILKARLRDTHHLVEINEFQYIPKGKTVRSETVYKLRNDLQTNLRLFQMFYDNDNIYEFLNSDYFQNSHIKMLHDIVFKYMQEDIHPLSHPDMVVNGIIIECKSKETIQYDIAQEYNNFISNRYKHKELLPASFFKEILDYVRNNHVTNFRIRDAFKRLYDAGMDSKEIMRTYYALDCQKCKDDKYLKKLTSKLKSLQSETNTESTLPSIDSNWVKQIISLSELEKTIKRRSIKSKNRKHKKLKKR